MRTVPKWVNKIHEADKIEFSSVHTICYSPDGTQLVIGAGEKVMVYDPRDGSLVQLLQAHKGAVHAVAYCGDGKKFASGSADKNVIIWTSKMEGVLKYSHGEAIQCLAYNPVTFHLASCALSDFAFWSTEVKAVQKYRVTGRITSCAWSPNGQYLAVGLAIGAVSIRDKVGDEIKRITREAAVWAVNFSKSNLLISDWNETLSFYNVQGQQILKERNIGIAALSLSMLGELILVGGVAGWAVLTSEGVPILNTPQEWVWSITPSPSLATIAVGCQDGTLWCYQTLFSTVHGLYRERYAYRENMTDVIIQHLTTGTKVRIKCHDRVQKIAIYKHRLAVQLPERVVVYEQGDSEGMLYRVKEKLPQKTECSLLVATSDALLLCQDTKLSIIGRRIPKTWIVPSPIRYVKVTTLYFEEVLLLGLLNGQIWQVEPRGGGCKLVLSTPGSVRCLDVSAARGRLAVVDDASVARVYSLPTEELLYTEENVSSVSWNSWCDELLALSGGGLLAVKAAHFPPATQPLQGSVVGFQGGRVFCLQSNSMQTINVPLSHAVHQYLQQKMFNEAYAVACLGVTPLDWERLGEAALSELSFEVARKAFQRSENLVFLSLIDHLQERFSAGEKRTVITGEVLAHRGLHAEAARAFRGAGRDDRALDLYVDLRMFNKAQEFVGEGEGGAALARRRAEWARHVNEPRAAAEMYLAAGDVRRAAQLMADSGRRDMLIELSRKLDKGSSESLRYVAEALAAAGEPAAAADVYQRLGDYRKVAQLAVAAGEWARAFSLAREHAECRRDVYLPHAHRMARENKFVEAQKAYHMGGETETARRVFSILVNNAVAEERFSDAGYLHYLLATQCLETAAAAHSRLPALKARQLQFSVVSVLVNNAVAEEHFSDAGYLHYLLATQCLETAAAAHSSLPALIMFCHIFTSKERERDMREYATSWRLARVYHAYEAVHRCVHEPFSLSQPDALLNAARFVLALVGDRPPPGVSMFCLYLCLAKQAKTLNAHSLARQMLDKILALQIPQKFQTPRGHKVGSHQKLASSALRLAGALDPRFAREVAATSPHSLRFDLMYAHAQLRTSFASSRESVELLILKSRAGGAEARDDVSPLCWRCRRQAAPAPAPRCAHCRHTPAYSLPSHDVLPLVQFVPGEGISYEEASELIERTTLPESDAQEDAGGAEVLRIDHEVDASDPFLDKFDEEEEGGPVVCSRGALLRLSPASVVVVRQGAGAAVDLAPPIFYRNMLPELPVIACPHCGSLFYVEDYEVLLVTKGQCPFCRQAGERDARGDADSSPSTPRSDAPPLDSWR